MLDILVILLLGILVTFYLVGFGFPRPELTIFIGVFIMALGFGIFSTGYTVSSQGVPGSYYEVTDQNVTPQPVTLVGNPTTQLEHPNFSWDIFLIAIFLTTWGFDMILHGFGYNNGEEE